MSSDPNKLDEAIERDVRPYLDLVDALRSQGAQEELSLPQIAVMGDQSSGKSSVLEASEAALSGVQFPRGSGLVTRCPVQLVMKRTEAGSKWKAKASVLWHRGEQPKAAGDVSSPDQLQAVISELMETVCGGDTANGFSTDTIVVQVESPNSPDLTLIDLPGIVRTAVEGQQQSVIREVNALIESYLGQERTIILAIVPANQDVATVDILERAQAVDPNGERTIGVLTKPDLIGPGNEDEVVAVLQNRRKPLKLGYVMVKNRTQLQLSDGMGLEEAHKDEMAFFNGHSRLSSISPEKLGIESLTKRCVGVLVRRIKHTLPTMKWELQEGLDEVERELGPLERNVPKTYPDRLKSFMQIITDFTRLLRASIEGEYRDKLLNSEPNLRVRSQVDKCFRSLQQGVTEMNPGFELPDFPRMLADELAAHRGRELCGMVNSQFFYIFMLQQVEKVRPVVEHAREGCASAVLEVATELIEKVSPQYPELVELVKGFVTENVELSGEAMQPELDLIFDKERNPFTENQDLVNAINQVRFERFDRVLHQVMIEAGEKPPPGTKGLPPLEEWVALNLGHWYRYSHGANPTSKVEDMSTVLQAYWRVTSKRVCDNACMLLETAFLDEVVNALETQLLTKAQQMKDAEMTVDRYMLTTALADAYPQGLFIEDAVLANKREFLEMRKKRIVAALDRISEVAPGVVATSRRQTGDDIAVEPAANEAPAAAAVAVTKKPQEPSQQEQPQHEQPQHEQPQQVYTLEPEVHTSEPEQLAAAAKDGSAAHFVYKGKQDSGGLIYWLGTGKHTHRYRNPQEHGEVKVTSSGMKTGTEAALVARKRAAICTKSDSDAWLCIDVGQHLSLRVSHYSLCNGSPEKGYDMVNWVFEGYDDCIRMWVILKHLTGPAALPSPHGVGTWSVDSLDKPYRFLRLRSTGENGRAGKGLCVCAWEMYGILYNNSA
ncbi:unnamed protein product [Chrysoparadoxa australica]